MIKKFSAKIIFENLQRQGLIDKDITYREFFYITREFNKEISKEVLEGYKFTSIIGNFEIIKRNRNGKAIDWNSSKLRKQRLIDEGKVPFSKKDAPEGENWFVYFTSSAIFQWKWNRLTTFWTFIPCIANKRNLGKVVNRKIETQTEDYVPLKNSFVSAYSQQNSQNIQTI